VDLLRADQPIVLLHSGRAAAHFSALCDHHEIARAAIRLATLAPAIAAGAGEGWADVTSAETPDDMALLAAAARLCH
jgi:uroporphyrinogen-III synthase